MIFFVKFRGKKQIMKKPKNLKEAVEDVNNYMKSLAKDEVFDDLDDVEVEKSDDDDQ